MASQRAQTELYEYMIYIFFSHLFYLELFKTIDIELKH